MKLESNVFVVTGAGNGMGRQVAMEIVRRGGRVAGADVNVAGLNETARLIGSPKHFSAHNLDISDHSAVAAFPQEVLARHGQVDGLFNIAGIAQEFEFVEEVSDQRIETIMRVNFFGTVWMTRAFLPLLHTRPEGVIMNTASMSAVIPVPGSAIYAASKSAVALFGFGLAQDLRKSSNVTVTTVFPGAIWTDMVKQAAAELGVSEAMAKRFATMPDAAAHRMIQSTLKGRARVMIGTDAHIYDAVSRISTRLADRLSYLQVGTFMYKPKSSVAPAQS